MPNTRRTGAAPDGGSILSDRPMTLPGPAAEARRCPHMDDCPMYRLMSYAGTLAAWKIRYCTGPYETCARFTRSLQGLSVPINLMPNGSLLNKKEPVR